MRVFKILGPASKVSITLENIIKFEDGRGRAELIILVINNIESDYEIDKSHSVSSKICR